ncbi:HpcH/HpaI aldolase family protein [Pseudomonas mangiferae]|nr:aldolase/citrate lyase family protein [Pseudomonas mangiferae]
MPVRPNPFTRDLNDGRCLLGTWLMSARHATMLNVLRLSGLDFVKVDMEHTPISLETVADMALLARALDFSLVVRPPDGGRVWVNRLLDAGVWNLYVPQIHNAEMARQLVQVARYAPLGNRGTFEPGPQDDYCEPGEPSAQLPALNRQVHLTVMLESIEAFENLDEIASVPGIDALAMGPADLAQELGIYQKPEEQAVIREYQARLQASARAHGKQLEIGVWSTQEAREWRGRGAQILTYMTDTMIIRERYQEAVQAFQA